LPELTAKSVNQAKVEETNIVDKMTSVGNEESKSLDFFIKNPQ
jgi:hypothetical protein